MPAGVLLDMLLGVPLTGLFVNAAEAESDVRCLGRMSADLTRTSAHDRTSPRIGVVASGLRANLRCETGLILSFGSIGHFPERTQWVISQ